MSVVDRWLILDDRVLGLGGDRVGLAARWAFIAVLTEAYSDGTLPYGESTLKHKLLAGIDLDDAALSEVRRRLSDSGLIVPYEAEGRQWALVPLWWKQNTRPEKARRAYRSPPVPDELLERFPSFAQTYRLVPTVQEAVLRKRRPKQGGKRRERAGTARHSVPDPDPEPEAVTAPASVTAPVPSPARATAPPRAEAGSAFELTRVVLPVVVAFEQTYLATFPEEYPTTEGEQRDVLALWETLDPGEQDGLENDVPAYFENTLEPTLGGFCEWRRERARRGLRSVVATGNPPPRPPSARMRADGGRGGGFPVATTERRPLDHIAGEALESAERPQ